MNTDTCGCYEKAQLDKLNEELEKRMDEEQGRWQQSIYEILVAATDDRIDGGGCDSGDPLDFTLTEIHQAIDFLREQQVEWNNIATAPADEPLWLWAPDWVDEDFNPSGVKDGFWSDADGWVVWGWDACNDVFTTIDGANPTKWAYKIKPDTYKEK